MDKSTSKTIENFILSRTHTNANDDKSPRNSQGNNELSRTPTNSSQNYRSAAHNHLCRWGGDAERLEQGVELLEGSNGHDDNGSEVHVVLCVECGEKVFPARRRFISFPQADTGPIHDLRAGHSALRLSI